MARISQPEDSQDTSQSQPANGKTILLAEDDPFISRMYQIKLEAAGYKVVLVNNGRDAYEQAKALQPDLTLMDINMPELSGLDVIKALQNDGQDEQVKRIIILTNSADPNDRKWATDLGLDYIIKAELTPKDVLDRINKRIT